MNILITGASEGIGLEVPKILAKQNHKITLIARSKENLEKALTVLGGKNHHIIVADLSKKEDVDDLKKVITNNKFDVFVNNAGFGMYGRFTEMDLSQQVKMMNLNITALTVLSYFYLSQAKKGDALVNVASLLGSTSYPGAAVYAATKAFVTNFSESLWWENKSKGIFVCAFCPGGTATNFHKVAGLDKDSFSKAAMQSAEQVAIELVRGLEKRKSPKIVSGIMNRFTMILIKILSRKSVIN